MKLSAKTKKPIAGFFLLVFAVETFLPVQALALTGGPSTPEMAAFQPASVSNMVDLFSGDFTYNIPLLDVGGYPVNLAYRAGSGPEDEASWVGFGWTLNPGAINRQLRGLPDDFAGDPVTQVDNKKPNITTGANINMSLKLFGQRFPKIRIRKKRKNVDGNLKIKIGIQHNNYTGYKGIIGIGTAFGTSDDASDMHLKNLSATATDLSAGAGISVDNQSGINPYANFEINYKIKSKSERDAEKAVASFNDDPGSKTLAQSRQMDKMYESSEELARKNLKAKQEGSHSNGASIDFSRFEAPSSIQMPMVSKNFTASLSLGITLFNGTVSPTIEGTFAKQELERQSRTVPAFGFMNSEQARDNGEALLDYTMEKESPYLKRLPNLGVPVFNADLYNVSSNAGSMQFRTHLRGGGVFFQADRNDVDKSTNIGLEPAWGQVFHIGVPLQLNRTTGNSGKWRDKNNYLANNDFQPTDPSNPANQAFYFKQVGEKSRQDDSYLSSIGQTSAAAVLLKGGFSAWAFGKGHASEHLRLESSQINDVHQARTKRDLANHSISYLTSKEAASYALDRTLASYQENIVPTAANAVREYISRVEEFRKPHHISQFIVTQDDGQRMVYGLPVYNIYQEEVSFALDKGQAVSPSLAIYNGTDNSPSNGKGKDNYFHKTITPPYTTGHLLTGIVSPDYVDVTGNGITDDDLGSAVKFNYSQLSSGTKGEPKYFKWRTPYSNINGNVQTANYNEGYKTPSDDDKANYTWGTKEIWNLHSIESKTMVALFVTSNRNDGLGVFGEYGGRNSDTRLKRLTEIYLYSKAELYKVGQAAATPIKVVHFEYYEDDYLMTGVPNSVNGTGGKLTLKRIWFSYGKSLKGQYHPYEFKYDIPTDKGYQANQVDRWGTYKRQTDNPSGLNNLEFPYSTQKRTEADANAGYWQLNEIVLPSGGVINVKYESDDYSYVQNRRAAQMYEFAGVGALGASSGFYGSNKIYVKLPTPTTDDDLRKRYLAGVSSLSYRAYVNLDNRSAWEYVQGYLEVNALESKVVGSNNDVAEIVVLPVRGFNPIAAAAWQKLRVELPRYAFPEYDNLDAEGSGFIRAIRALGAAFGRFGDLVESFDMRAIRKHYGYNVQLDRSFIRLNTGAGKNTEPGNSSQNKVFGKLGGGHRVSRITLKDNWSELSGVANAESGSFGVQYDYKKKVTGPTGLIETISSGVATYEPALGGEENPFREPINYKDKQLFGKVKYFYIERPLGEAYFPGASVGYSTVTVSNIGADGSVGKSGSTTTEFYTSKDFPTKVSETKMQRQQPKLSFLPRLFGAKLTSAVTVSQGYAIENNDMNGKEKSETIFDKFGKEVSSTSFYYKVTNPKAETLDLNNKVDVVGKGGVIEPNQTVGLEVDMFSEMTESSMENMGIAIDPTFGFALWGPAPVFSVALPLPKPNYEKRIYRGSTTVKLINRFALLDKVVKKIEGSKSTTQNLLWDEETGEVLLTQTNNEFEDPVYSFGFPAHWIYDGMGSAFRNEGVYLSNFLVNADGSLPSAGILVEGDELVDLNQNNHFWLIKVPAGTQTKLALVDANGIYNETVPKHYDFKVLRSGRRNLMSASVGTIVSLINPISSGTLNFSSANKVLSAAAVEYKDTWSTPFDENCQENNVCYSVANSATTSAISLLGTKYFEKVQSVYTGGQGTAFYTSGYNGFGAGDYQLITTEYWTNNFQTNNNCGDGPLNRSGIWFTSALRTSRLENAGNDTTNWNNNSSRTAATCNGPSGTGYLGKWVGTLFTYSTSVPKTLFVGIGADNFFRVKLNGKIIIDRSSNSSYENFQVFNVYPVCLAAGSYTFEFQGKNQDQYSPGAFGVEVYDNTLQQLLTATSLNPPNIIYTTTSSAGNIVETGDEFGYATSNGFYVTKTGSNYFGKLNDIVINQVVSTAPRYFNPFRNGGKGNWRMRRQSVYDTRRVRNKLNTQDPGGTNLRNSGYYETFTPFNWQNGSNPGWQWTTESTKFGSKGEETESQNALEQYSSAQFGYLQSLPIAVAGNARVREIGFDGFEDYDFQLGLNQLQEQPCGIQRHFSFNRSLSSLAVLDGQIAHTGRYSLRLNGGSVTIERPMLSVEPTNTFDVAGSPVNKYYVTSTYLKYGFLPIPSKRYVLSGWVYDGAPRSASIENLEVRICGTQFDLNNNALNPNVISKVYQVEGWKRFEVTFIMPASGMFTLNFKGTNVYLDDVRIHPYDAQMKSYAYDATSLRLMGELDENNFATFYEYDDEGVLIRVKKETEKGINTIRESRSSQHRK